MSLPPATKLGQGYVFTGMCDSVHRGGVPDQVHPPGPGTPPRSRYPPGTRYTPPLWDQVHTPGTRYTPRTRYTPLGPGTPPRNQEDAVYVWAVRILLECILVGKYDITFELTTGFGNETEMQDHVPLFN